MIAGASQAARLKISSVNIRAGRAFTATRTAILYTETTRGSIATTGAAILGTRRANAGAACPITTGAMITGDATGTKPLATDATGGGTVTVIRRLQ